MRQPVATSEYADEAHVVFGADEQVKKTKGPAQFSIAEVGVLFPRLFLRLFPRY